MLRTSVFVDGDYFDVATRHQLHLKVDYRNFAEALHKHFGKETSLYLFRSLLPRQNNNVDAEDVLRKAGFKVHTSPLYKGRTTIKTNIDVIIASGILVNARGYDRAVIVSGDNDFVPVIDGIRSLRKQAIIAGIPLTVGRELRARAHGFIDIEEVLQGKFDGLPSHLQTDERIETLRTRYFAKGYELEAYAEIRRIISLSASRVWLVDRYVTSDVVRLLNSAEPAVRISIWTEKDRQNAESEARSAKAAGRDISLYYIGKDFHGRHLIVDDLVWHLGHSLKDLGASDAVVQLLDDEQALQDLEQRLHHLAVHSVT